MAGVHAEIRTMFAQSAQKYIVASRMSQGNEDFNTSSAEEREDIEMRWLGMRNKMKGFYALKQKEKGKSRDASPSALDHASSSAENMDELPRTGWFQSRSIGADEKRVLLERKKAWKKKRAEGLFVEEDMRSISSTDNTHELGDEFETAIQAAVHETSRGDAVEDARIEQAIRSSVKIMKQRSTTLSSLASSNSTFSNTGTQPSGWVSDVKRAHGETPGYSFSSDDLENITDEEYQALIEEAIKLSITENQHQAIRMYDLENDEDDRDIKRALEPSQTEESTSYDDEEYKRALEASQAEHEAQKQHERRSAEFDEQALHQAIEASKAEQQTQQPQDDEELKRALEESEKAHQEELDRINSLRSEEDIVMEYVKKQSLAEAAFRNAKEKITGAYADTEDEDLRRALEESMKTDGEMKRGGGGGSSQS